MDENEIKSLKEKAKIPENHNIRIISAKNVNRGSYDTDIDIFEELDETGNPIFRHTVTSATLKYPPFHTTISHHRENIE